MKAECLLEGAEFLEKLELGPNDIFDISVFSEGLECGTAACAAGWMAIKGLFGMILDEHGGPTLHGLAAWTSLETVFGLERRDAAWLFDPWHYRTEDVTKEMVAARMRHLAAGGSQSTWTGPA